MARVCAVFVLLLLSSQLSEAKICWNKVGGLVAGAAAVGILGPVALAGMGFSAGGVASGSIGATMMSSGMSVASLQSAGTAGISHSTIAAGGAITSWFFDCE